MRTITSNKAIEDPGPLDGWSNSFANLKWVKGIKVYSSGLAISFLGALPLGTLNLTAFDISASQGLVHALWFGVAVVFVELFMVWLALYGSERLRMGVTLAKYLYPMAILLFWYLAYSSFWAPADQVEVSQAAFMPKIASPFLLGLLLSALNPLQLPFWVTWNKVLQSKGILGPTTRYYPHYLTGIGVGTYIALLIFSVIGAYFMDRYHEYTVISNFLLGAVYLGFSFYLIFLLIKKRLKTNIK